MSIPSEKCQKECGWYPIGNGWLRRVKGKHRVIPNYKYWSPNDDITYCPVCGREAEEK